MGESNPAPQESASRTFSHDAGPDPQALAQLTGQSAERFLEEGFRLAVEQVQRKPSSSMAHLALGREYWIRGAHLQAAEAYEEACDRDPRCICARRSSAEAAAWVGYHEVDVDRKAFLKRALARLEEILNFRPQDYQALFQAGQVAYWLEEDLGQAQNYFNRALEVDPKNADASFYIGCIQRDLLRFDQAEHWFKHTLRLDPQKADALFELGRIQLDCGNHEAALARLEETLRYDPDHVEAGSLLGRLREQRELNEVIQRELGEGALPEADEIQLRSDLPSSIRSMAMQARAKDQLVELGMKDGTLTYAQQMSVRGAPITYCLSLDRDGSGSFALRSRSSESQMGMLIHPQIGFDETVSLLRAVAIALEEENFTAAAACLQLLNPDALSLYPIVPGDHPETLVFEDLSSSLNRLSSSQASSGWWTKTKVAITSLFRR